MAARAEFLDALERVLPAKAPGISPRRAHEIVDLWSLVHVRISLRQLEAAGRAVSEFEPTGSRTAARLYRRTQEHAQ